MEGGEELGATGLEIGAAKEADAVAGGGQGGGPRTARLVAGAEAVGCRGGQPAVADCERWEPT